MSKFALLLAASLVALGSAAHAADDTTATATKPHKQPTLAATSNAQLRQADVPSVKTDPDGANSVKAKADADMAARDARGSDRSPRLEVQRQNLKGDDAKRAIAARTTPNTIDHDTAYGDMDHTEQVTDLKLTLKK
jgi:hypothetical protein